MTWLSKRIVLTAAAAILAGCATSMTPREFNASLPKATSARYFDRIGAVKAVSNGECRSLVDGRKYTAPIGLTVAEDLKNAARGIDEWVQADGGNAYSVVNFEWISVGDEGTTQLIVYFDTLYCG